MLSWLTIEPGPGESSTLVGEETVNCSVVPWLTTPPVSAKEPGRKVTV